MSLRFDARDGQTGTNIITKTLDTNKTILNRLYFKNITNHAIGPLFVCTSFIDLKLRREYLERDNLSTLQI